MKQILSDFIRRRTGMLIKCALIAVGFAAAAWIPLMFSGGWADWFRLVWTIGAVVVSAAVASLLVKAFVDIFGVARCRLEEQLSNMPEAEREGVISAYPSAKALGERWFMPEHILFYTARRALLLRYDDANVTHVEGSTDPLRDIDIINTELIMADLEMIDRRIDKAQKNAKGGDKRFNHEVEVFTALRDYMNEGNLARTFECSEDDAAMIATSDLLTLRKTIYAANLSENDVNQPEACKYFTQVQALAAKEGSEVLPICAKLEADIAELDDPDEKAMFMEELGLQQSGLDRLIQCSYELLGLISFLTAGADECRAWTIKKGTKAPQAAGKIHSDFERGFIRAEVIAFDDLKACGTLANAKAKGLLRSEGKEYIMHDGDVVNFLFNV